LPLVRLALPRPRKHRHFFLMSPFFRDCQSRAAGYARPQCSTAPSHQCNHSKHQTKINL
jgi:hypothetical protein